MLLSQKTPKENFITQLKPFLFIINSSIRIEKLMRAFQISKLKSHGREDQTSSKVIVDNQYLVLALISRHFAFSMYEGISLKSIKYVHVYIKPASNDFSFDSKIKEELRLKISPPVIWSGSQKIIRQLYNIQIHQKYGPSLRKMFNFVQNPISSEDFLLLMYKLLRIVEKYSSVGYVFRELNLDNIVFDARPQKNDLYLLNIFSLKKSGEQFGKLKTKFCSKASHLGLKSSIKDDLQSICYILIYVYSQGEFLREVDSSKFFDCKTKIDMNSFRRPFHPIFIDFYSFVNNINYGQEINFFKWRSLIYQTIGRDRLMKPFGWMINSSQKYLNSQKFKDGCFYNSLDYLQLEDQITNDDKHSIQKISSKVLRITTKN